MFKQFNKKYNTKQNEKSFFYLMMAFAVTASTLTSCEDVPSPYDNPNNKKQEVTPSQANGSGTEADPYNVAALNAHLKSLKADSATAETFVKGKVVAIKELQTKQLWQCYILYF